MARPKSDDPTVSVQFRMKKSAHDWWATRAEASGMKLHKLLQQVTENRARAASETFVAPSRGGGKTAALQEARADVSPNFKGKS